MRPHGQPYCIDTIPSRNVFPTGCVFRTSSVMLKALHRRCAEAVPRFSKTERHSCQGEAALRWQLEVNGGPATKEGIQQRKPAHLKKIDILQKRFPKYHFLKERATAACEGVDPCGIRTKTADQNTKTAQYEVSTPIGYWALAASRTLFLWCFEKCGWRKGSGFLCCRGPVQAL